MELELSLPESERAMLLFVLKADLETLDDEKLALLEIESLTGESPTEVASNDLSPDVKQAVVSLDAASRKLVTVEGPHDLVGLENLAFSEFVITISREKSKILATSQTMLEKGWGASGAKITATSLGNRRKNEYLSHAYHKYKAKFFPRMARALANAVVPDGGILLDPFMGSGTLAVEGALLGLETHGVDIDPLSIEIASTKVQALSLPAAVIEKALHHLELCLPGMQGSFFDTVPTGKYQMPDFIGRKIDRAELRQIESEAGVLFDAVETCVEECRPFLRLTLSHALATKVTLRWMGTGDNRFALALAARSLTDIARTHLRRMYASSLKRDRLVEAGVIDPEVFGRVFLQQGDARALPYGDGQFDGIVTSPPYIPAASGRETYLRSRGPSLVALGLMTEAEILSHEQDMIGTIMRGAPADSPGLPQSIEDLVRWMSPQRARAPKALPTAAYFLDIAASLREMARVVKCGGRIALVLSARHTFYDINTRETVRVLSMPDTISEIIDDPASDIGLDIERVITVQLPKMDFKARPAARGDYAEAIIVARRI